jgi:hypothetical protein
MEKYGFVYIWRDRKHKRYYIGSHWGLESDGYLCSSNWMRDAYKRRPNDFKRRILARVRTTRADLYLEEERWLKMIKPEEVKKRYYNLALGSTTHWTSTDNSLSIREKISKACREYWDKPGSRESQAERSRGSSNRRYENPAAREKLSEAQRKRWNLEKQGGVKGVSWQKSKQKWRARIDVRGNSIHLGLFDDKREAGLTYDAAARFLGLSFYLNFPSVDSEHIVLSGRVLCKLAEIA